MILDSFFGGKTYLALKGQMDTSATRQKVYANNIANVDTPNFKRSEVNFEDAFKQALAQTPNRLSGKTTNQKHIPINAPTPLESVKPTIWRQNDEYSRSDNNNVDIDIEMAELAKNEMMFNAVAEILSRKFSGLKKVISAK